MMEYVLSILVILISLVIGFLSSKGELYDSQQNKNLWKRFNIRGKWVIGLTIAIVIIAAIQLYLTNRSQNEMKLEITNKVKDETQNIFDKLAIALEKQGLQYDSSTTELNYTTGQKFRVAIRHQNALYKERWEFELRNAKQQLLNITELIFKRFSSETGFNKFLSGGALYEGRRFTEAKAYLQDMNTMIVSLSSNIFLAENPDAMKHWTQISNAIDAVANHPYDGCSSDECKKLAIELINARETSFRELIRILKN